MSNLCNPTIPSALTLELFQPSCHSLYSLDAIAQLTGVSRRSILVFCRAGLVHPVFLAPYGIMAFTERAIYTVRRIEDLRTSHGLSVVWIKSMFGLIAELERLQAEVSFLRHPKG
jgi:DNA-binding transcriptional MerR regulator